MFGGVWLDCTKSVVLRGCGASLNGSLDLLEARKGDEDGNKIVCLESRYYRKPRFSEKKPKKKIDSL